MPQMFPLPFLVLMIMIGILFMVSMVRLFWCGKHLSALPVVEQGQSPLNFKQTW